MASENEDYPTSEERERIRAFRIAFNRVDKELRRRTQLSQHIGFPTVLQTFGIKFGHDLDLDFLLKASRLRNLLIHEELRPHDHVAIPSKRSLATLQAAAGALWEPIKVIPIFKKKVRIVSLDDTLENVLKLIGEADFSQFPVYSEQKFRGLLTENGITRWLAHHAKHDSSALRLDSVRVRELLREEEARGNYAFVSRADEVRSLRKRFADEPALEAALITDDGSENKPLLGLATTWDITRVKL